MNSDSGVIHELNTSESGILTMPSEEDLKEQLERRKQKAQEAIENFGSDRKDEPLAPWDLARNRFPKTEFPEEVFPQSITVSLKQLARSYATSFHSLPSAVIAILSSILGRTIAVLVKISWIELLSFWFADIRPSGAGKTPAARALCRVLYWAQKKAEQEYRARIEIENTKSPKERSPVKRARGYFSTELTLEGLRADLEDLGNHGGQVCIMDELSSFLTAQNQYKNGKGNDREAWIAIHDGHPARIVRAKESKFIEGACVSIFGGIQPAVWCKYFGSDDGLYLKDGTVFRFLPTIEGLTCIPLTDESWSDESRAIWECTLTRAMEWADEHCSKPDWRPFVIKAEQTAWILFRDWVNNLKKESVCFPDSFQGFLPKAYGYAVRFAGALHCLHRFADGHAPSPILSCQDMERGIRVVEFYLGQAVEALSAIETGKCSTFDTSGEQARHLAVTLDSMRKEVESGKLAIGVIHGWFNQGLPPEKQIKTAKSMGSLIRNCGLNIPPGTCDANGKRSVKCMSWDEKTEFFLKQYL